MSNRVGWGALLLGTASSLAFLVGIGTQSLLIGSAEGGWVYRYVQDFSIHAVFVGLLAAAAVGAALRLPAPRAGRREWILVAAWIVIALALQAFLRSLTLFSFESIFVSDGANSFYSVTERHDPWTVLREFSRVQRGAAVHAQSNMPGKLLLIYALRLFSERPDILPWLTVAVSNAGGVLMYLFVRDLSGDRTIAIYSMVLYYFVPAKLVFFPLMNTVTPVLLLACLCLLMRWLRTGALWPASLLGVAFYLLVLFEPLPLVMGLVFAALSIAAVVRRESTWHRLVLQTCVMVVAFVLTAELVLLATGFNLVESFARIRRHAVEFNAAEGRPYALWIGVNLWEFVAGMGVCQAVLYPIALGAGLSGPGSVTERLARPLTALSVSLLAVLAVTDLIGINRGEIVRLWIFLACMFQIPAAYVCARLRHPAAIFLVAATSVVHAALTTRMVGFIVP